jgi:MFS family permease
VLLGSMIGPLDSAVNAAFPAISAAFGLEVAAIRWVVISYLVTFSSCVIVSGRLGDFFGYRRVFGIGLLLSSAAFVACALAPAYGWLLAARVAQGVGAALVLGAGPALALSIYPETERTRVLARFGAAFAAGLAAGPALGGGLVDAWGWQSVFLGRLPIALAAWLLLVRVPAPPAKSARRFHATGPLLLAAWTGCLLLALSLPGAAALALGLAAVVAFAAFVRHEARSPQPIVRLALFRSASFAVPNLAGVAVHFAGFTIFLLGPYLFVREMGLSAQLAGVLLAMGPTGAAIGSTLAERLARPLGVRRIAFAGMALTFAGVAVASTWHGGSNPWFVGFCLALQGTGIGLFQVAYTDLVIATLPPEERGVASSLTNFTRTLGVVGCAALASALFRVAESGGSTFVQAYGFAFSSVAAGSALFLVLTLLRPRVWFPR